MIRRSVFIAIVENTIFPYFNAETKNKISCIGGKINNQGWIRLRGKKGKLAQTVKRKKKLLGVSEGDLQSMTLPRKFGVAKDILESGTALVYDAILVGRRGMDKQYFTGSVSRYLVNQFSDGAIWMVP